MVRRGELVIGVAIAVLAAALGRVPIHAVAASLESEGVGSCARIERRGSARLVVDPVLGQEAPLPSRPSRIASLTLASDVMLASLVDVDRVVAVTALVDDEAYSGAAHHYPPSVLRVTASAEPLLALEPDLVVVSGYSHPATVRALVGAGTTVLRLPSGRSLDEIQGALSLLAEAVGSTDRADRVLAPLASERAALSGRPRLSPRPRVLFLAAGGFTHGRGTLTDELIELAGARNIARERGIDGLARIGAEVIAAASADLIVVPAESAEGARAAVEMIAPGLDDLLAETPIVAIPPSAIETTTPEAITAARVLRAALERTSNSGAAP